VARLHIRLLETPADFEACELIQKAVWNTRSVSSEVIRVTQKYGGAALAAFIGGRMVGFIYALLAQRHDRLIHWSHMMAVLPKFRNLGIGFRMKMAHRELALRQGLHSICWTYDPLQSPNATLNISRLGARVEEYVPDYYGHFPSSIEKSLPSDRFVVDWRIASAAVRRKSEKRQDPPPHASLPQINKTKMNARGFLENQKINFSLREPGLLVEIPSNTDAMREQAIRPALRWRLESRAIFQQYLSAGYRVADFLAPLPATDGRCFYLLRRARAKERRGRELGAAHAG